MWFFVILALVAFFIYANASAPTHIHQYVKISFREGYDERRNLRYSIRTYRCRTCGKVEEVDTRHGDPYD